MFKDKPIGRKSYGHIPHLIGSRMGHGDHACHEGQVRIATIKTRDKHDRVIVQEKLDGSNVSVAKKDGIIYSLGRAGYKAISSPYLQHRLFANWVEDNRIRFDELLKNDERLCGEWLAQAHSTRYKLIHEPFVAFDIITGVDRLCYNNFIERITPFDFISPHVIHNGGSISIDSAMNIIGKYGYHGAIDPVEGVVWRIERNKLLDHNSGMRRWIVDFLCKYVRPDKEDGIYLPDRNNNTAELWNWYPKNKENI